MALKIAIVGTGNVAVQNYIPYLAAQPDVALGYFNRNREKAEQVARQFPGKVFASLNELAGWQPAVAMVLTNEMFHLSVANELIDLGIARIFFEKPLVAADGQAHVCEQDFHDGKKMLTAATAKGCQTAMIFNYRFFDQSRAARQMVAERDLGQVIHACGQVHYACWSHCIDLIQHFSGPLAEITALSGEVVREGQGIKARDLVAALRMENGATGTLIGTAGMSWQHPLYELTLTFERGRIHMRDIDGPMEILDGHKQVGEMIHIGRDASRWTQYANSFKKSLEAYLNAVRENREPPVPAAAGLLELQVEAAMRRSVAERRPVKVQEEFPLVYERV